MPSLRSLCSLVVSAAVLAAAGPALAQDTAPPGDADAHLASGAKLLDEENYAAARAEFEAAYHARPGAGPLLQIAACERALFRYPQAIAALERALHDHGASLSEADRKAAEAQLAELKAQLGFVQVVLVPPTAALRIDGEDQPPGATQRTIPLAPGSHRLEARLAGHVPEAQTITLDSGETAAIKLRLVPEGEAVKPPPVRGPYALATLGVFVPLPPSDFSGTAVGISAGARAGYRFLSFLGGEVGFTYAHAATSGQGKPAFADMPGATYPIGYTLSSARFSAHLRLMTTGERVRFVQTLGGGVALDAVSWTPGKGGLSREGASGVNGFAQSETGLEVDLGGVLLGLVVDQHVGTGGGLDRPKHDLWSAETYGGPQYAIGVGLRGGYRFW